MLKQNLILAQEQNSNVHRLLIHVNHQNDLIDVVYAIWHDDFETKSNTEKKTNPSQ